MQFSDAIWWRHNKSKMADGRHIENRFFAISRRHISRSTRNLEQRWRITCRYRSREQNCNFRKFKIADGHQFENSIISISQPRIIRFRSNLVIRCIFQFPWCTFNKKIEIFKIQDGGRTPYWKSYFGHNSALYWPIDAKFESEIQNHMPIQDTWPKLQFSQIQDGGRPPFWK